MQNKKSIEELETEIKVYKDLVKELREHPKVVPILNAETLPRKTAAAEAHVHVLAGRNIGVVGIGSVVLTLMVAMINSVAASITAFICIGVLGYMTFMRVKTAQYLEQKYGLESKPIFNSQTAKQGGFQI